MDSVLLRSLFHLRIRSHALWPTQGYQVTKYNFFFKTHFTCTYDTVFSCFFLPLQPLLLRILCCLLLIFTNSDYCCPCRWRRPCDQEWEQPPRAGKGPWLTTSRKMGNSVLQQQELISAEDLNKLASRFFIRATRGELSKADTLWCLNLCVDLTGLKEAWIAGKTFLGVFVRLFLKEISIQTYVL